MRTYWASTPALLPYAIWISFQHLPCPEAVTPRPPRRRCSYLWLQGASVTPRGIKVDCGSKFWSQMAWARIPAFPCTSCATLSE